MIAQTIGHFTLLLIRNRAVIAISAFMAGAVAARMSAPIESAAQWGAEVLQWIGGAISPGGV